MDNGRKRFAGAIGQKYKSIVYTNLSTTMTPYYSIAHYPLDADTIWYNITEYAGNIENHYSRTDTTQRIFNSIGYYTDSVYYHYVKDGIGFKIWLMTTEGWNTQRDGLQIHPDGGKPGTKGCIGLTGIASDLSLFQKMVSPFTSGGNTSPLSVSIIGNPQCCRAADYDKGVPALFCK